MSKPCAFPGCDRPAIQHRTLCEAHRKQKQKGQPLRPLQDYNRESRAQLGLASNPGHAARTRQVQLEVIARHLAEKQPGADPSHILHQMEDMGRPGLSLARATQVAEAVERKRANMRAVSAAGGEAFRRKYEAARAGRGET